MTRQIIQKVFEFKSEIEKNTLEEKIGECMGLEKAAQKAVTYLDHQGLLKNGMKKKVFGMRNDAKGHENKMNRMLGWLEEYAGLDLVKIHEKSQETEEKIKEMMKTYLGDEPDTQEALEFLTLAEGGEVLHYEVLNSLSTKVKNKKFGKLVREILNQEKRHLRLCTDLSKKHVREE